MCSGAEAVGSHSGYAFADLVATYTVYYLSWLQESQFDEGPQLNLLGSFFKDSLVILCAYIRSKMEYALVMFTGVVTPLKHKLSYSKYLS